MAVFDESKVVNPLHKGKAVVGKKYYCADYFGMLKERVEEHDVTFIHKLIQIEDNNNCCFRVGGTIYALLYPYEEPPKKRMSNSQLAEWLSRGNGIYTSNRWCTAYTAYEYDKDYADEEVSSDYVIRPWGSDEWIEPTEEIYLRDC